MTLLTKYRDGTADKYGIIVYFASMLAKLYIDPTFLSSVSSFDENHIQTARFHGFKQPDIIVRETKYREKLSYAFYYHT